ncbi:MAG: zeta toxin family protein [Thermoguttaceae bacterium]
MSREPKLIILAGPNGAGKSTSAPLLLRDTFAVDEFVNADAIAQGLCAFAPETVALEAGKIMVKRLRDLAHRRVDFAFETTLASRSFAPWVEQLTASGYKVHLLFLSLPNADAASERVRARVRLGGHNIPEDVVRRRFASGLQNFFRLYIPVVTTWKLYDNTAPDRPLTIAEGIRDERVSVMIDNTYRFFVKEYANGQTRTG